MASATLRAAVRQILEEDYGRSGCGCIRQTINDNKRKVEKKDAEEQKYKDALNLIGEVERSLDQLMQINDDYRRCLKNRLEEAIKMLKGA